MQKIELKRSKKSSRAEQGHPWVFAGEIKKALPNKLNGKAVLCYDSRNHLLGSGIYNNNSSIVWRRFSRKQQEFSRPFLQEAITSALKQRANKPFCRLIWSESDSIPGLVVDRFQDLLVVQALTMAVDKQLSLICEILQKELSPREIVLRNDVPVRRLEGLELETATFSGKTLDPEWMTIDGIEYELDLSGAQKTGFYLDQREQHSMISEYASGRRVLDAFCNQGAFALHCAKAGAKEVVGVDSSETAISQAKKNGARNNLQVDFQVANVFDFFREKRSEKWDMIILDPPPFAKSKRDIGNALRGYKEINLRAMKQLVSKGILVSYSCSHHVDHAYFMDMLRSAAADAGRDVRVLRHTSQPLDHPQLLMMPESEYLRGVVLEIL